MLSKFTVCDQKAVTFTFVFFALGGLHMNHRVRLSVRPSVDAWLSSSVLGLLAADNKCYTN